MNTVLTATWMKSVAVCLLALMAGCAGLPARPPGGETHALSDVATTRLARILESSTPEPKRGLSGFRLLPEGLASFNARVALARRAEKSIDAQYYLIANDDIGRQFLRELRDAALRGVRVRLLIDDLYAAEEDELFMSLAAFPNVEVRVFNPLPMRRGGFNTRLLFSLPDFSRINHRMHNKVFVADNTFAVTGGRNIANEYFMRSEDANFIDIDVLSSGPVVHELSKAFDLYWNSPHVYPIVGVGDKVVAQRSPQDGQARFDELIQQALPYVPERDRDVLGVAPVSQQLDSGTLDQDFATATVLVDSPDKVAGLSDAQVFDTVSGRTLKLFGSAKKSIQIVSPYFIPGPRGIALIQSDHAAGVQVTLVTNAVAATDEPLVYARYAEYRNEMLKAGVKIYEISPTVSRDSGQLGSFGRSTGRLHAKAAIIDAQLLFIGSMNLDQRSARANTEVGLVIDSPELIDRHLRALFRSLTTSGGYELRLTPTGDRIQWVEHRTDGTSAIYDNEPESATLTRLKVWLMSPFISEGLL